MKVLLVYDHGMDISFYLIEDPIAKHITFLEDANNKFINGDEINKGMEFISDAVNNEKEVFSNEDNARIWVDKKVLPPVAGPVDKVYFSGILP